MADIIITVADIVNEWLEEVATRWEKGVDMICRDKLNGAELIEDTPNLPGDITFSDLIDELRKRKVRPTLGYTDDRPVKKTVKCRSCQATIAYLPEEVERYSGRDISGGPDGYERVKCPRTSKAGNCPGYGYIKDW